VNRDFVGFHKNRLVFELFGWLTHGEGLSYLGDRTHANRVMAEAVGNGTYRIPSTEQMLSEVRLIDGDSEGYVGRGRMYCALRRYEAALRDFQHAMNVRPGYELAYRNRLLAYCMMGNREKALEDVRYLEDHGHAVPPEILRLIPGK